MNLNKKALASSPYENNRAQNTPRGREATYTTPKSQARRCHSHRPVLERMLPTSISTETTLVS